MPTSDLIHCRVRFPGYSTGCQYLPSKRKLKWACMFVYYVPPLPVLLRCRQDPIARATRYPSNTIPFRRFPCSTLHLWLSLCCCCGWQIVSIGFPTFASFFVFTVSKCATVPENIRESSRAVKTFSVSVQFYLFGWFCSCSTRTLMHLLKQNRGLL